MSYRDYCKYLVEKWNAKTFGNPEPDYMEAPWLDTSNIDWDHVESVLGIKTPIPLDYWAVACVAPDECTDVPGLHFAITYSLHQLNPTANKTFSDILCIPMSNVVEELMCRQFPWKCIPKGYDDLFAWNVYYHHWYHLYHNVLPAVRKVSPVMMEAELQKHHPSFAVHACSLIGSRAFPTLQSYLKFRMRKDFIPPMLPVHCVTPTQADIERCNKLIADGI